MCTLFIPTILQCLLHSQFVLLTAPYSCYLTFDELIVLIQIISSTDQTFIYLFIYLFAELARPSQGGQEATAQ